MRVYEKMAEELFLTLDTKRKTLPHEEMSATMRGEMAVLRFLLAEENAVTAGELSRALDMATSRVAAVLNSLQKKELILRSTDAQDKRRVLVSLTGKGKVFCQEKRRDAVNHMTQMLSRLGEEDAGHFVRIMKRIAETGATVPPCSREAYDEQ